MKVFLTIILTLAMCGTSLAEMGANLCPPSSATDTAKQTGSWQDVATWTDGTVPTVSDRVFIPAGFTVTNHGTAAALWIHAAGKLTFCDHCDVQLNVHTIYVPMGGAFSGHATGNVVTEWLDGPFLPGDTTQLSRGLICHGECMLAGVEKTAWGVVTADLPVGSTSLKTPSTVGWNVGDRLIVTGTDSILGHDVRGHKYQSEFVTVTGLTATSNGTVVTFSPPLVYRHFRWRADLPFHVGNLTRNITFRSRDTSTIANRGHLMFMSSMVHMANVAIEGCGRTDGSRPVTDPRMDAYGELVPGSDDNVRARYAVHWHRVGQLTPPAICTGCVVDGSPKWGFLVHASNAHLRDCIATRCYGSGFATEEGQERGSMDRCLSVLNRGYGDEQNGQISTDEDHGRPDVGDWGIAGDGFWNHSGLMAITNCVACDNSGRGFGQFIRTLNGYPNYGDVAEWLRFPIEHDGTLLSIDYDGRSKTPASTVPVAVFDGNTAYGNKLGFQGWGGPTHDDSSNLIWPASTRSRITNLKLWGRGCMLHLEYMRQVSVDGLTILGDSNVNSDRQWFGSNPFAPVMMRNPHVSIKNLSIGDFLYYQPAYPQPVPIDSVGDGGVNPDHVIEGTYPVTKYGY